METSFEHKGTRSRMSAILFIGAVILTTLLILLTFIISDVQAQQTPTVSFRSTSIDVSEGAGQVQVVVQLLDPDNVLATGATPTVNYESFFGSASGADYTTVSGSLTFQKPTVMTRTITINITNDSIDEPTEFFYLDLSNPSSNVVLTTPYRIQINIIDNDDPPAPTATPGGIIYLDAYEPNNTFAQAYSVGVGASICNITFWPAGDIDYFYFFAKQGLTYQVFTKDLSPGIDTVLTLYDSSGNQIAYNDDVGEIGTVRSQIQFKAGANGFYYAKITNKNPADATGKTYCFEVIEVAPPTATPSQTPVA
ncbi:MAG: hypothetical protein IAF02_28630, partial [Anaerolineae bacterium]|nr:hypothetical protein [Anaerolineae bacterium]